MTELRVNGRLHRTDADDSALLYVLRDELGLSGPQFGCGLEQCGACKVLINGQALPSCRVKVATLDGAEVTTLEGLAEDGELHPVQQAFIDEQALQCGYCANGMLMTAAALVLQSNPSPNRIRAELADNLCRCGTHVRIVRAVKRAADVIWGET
jgi:nicotinate dehydrogenase subunit A